MQLNHRVTLQRRSATPGALGQASATWVSVDTVWAFVEPLRGRDWFSAGQRQSSADVRITLRYRDDVTADMRVVWNGTPHDLSAPPIDVRGEHRYLELMCVTGVRDGR